MSKGDTMPRIEPGQRDHPGTLIVARRRGRLAHPRTRRGGVRASPTASGLIGRAAFAIIKFGDLTGWWHIDYGSEAFHWLNPPPTVDVLKTFQQAI
jgi:hypothetical protein